jgi:arginine N-succinyltransferase
MLVIRPISLDDLDALFEMANRAGYGLTSLPKDREMLQNRIVESQESFARIGQKPRGEHYLFVLEDLTTGKAVGTCGVVAKVGGFEPFYAYKVETAIAQSDVLKVRKEIKFLKLVTEHSGPCEIGTLFLSPDYRKDNNGRVLSLSRFLFMAEFPNRFEPVVISELRGVVTETGLSPFWESLGRHFFDLDYPNADYLSVLNKKFIADLMPTHPIYIPLLPKEAQDVIGKCHDQSKPALNILLEEGFRFNEMVDIFDAGPVVQCRRDEIRTVRESRQGCVMEVVDEVQSKEPMIIGVSGPRIFRACSGFIDVLNLKEIRITKAVESALQVGRGSILRFATVRSRRSVNLDGKEI